MSPRHDYKSYTLGNMRNQQEDRPIEPRLTKGDEKLHYRTEVLDGKARTFVEGRLIHTEQLPENHDPWVALRNGDVQEGSAFNVRVTGTPEIPDTISMTPASNIASWLPYYGDTLAQWQGVTTGGIRGLRDGGDLRSESAPRALPLTAVTYHEQAIFYQRPMLEDGTIDYEFYYSDQSELLLVRNVQWTGKWPHELMAVSDQELSIEVAEFLDQKSEHLTAVFEHDFVRDGMNEDRITPVHGGGPETLRITPEGLVALRPGSDGYRNTTIAPNLQVQGDFDITVAYDNFESAPTTKGSSSLMLVALLDNPTADEFFVTRRHMFYAEGNEQQIVQCATVQKPPEGEKRDYFVTKVMEDRSGRLRLSRRGTVVYDLTKEQPDASILYRWVDLRE